MCPKENLENEPQVKKKPKGDGRIIFGVILILFGSIIILQEFFPSMGFWGTFLPIVLIVTGIILVARSIK